MSKRNKESRLYQNLLSVTEQFMAGKNFTPLTRNELMEKLCFTKEHTEVFKEVLKTMLDKGVVKFLKGRYYPVRKNIDTIRGVLKLHPRGFGFVSANDLTLYNEDIFIPKQFTQNAVDGDLVEVEINTRAISEKGPEGKISAILKRGRTHLAGTIYEIDRAGTTLAYAPLLGAEQRIVIEESDTPLKVGDRIIMEVIEWGSKNTETTCRFCHHLGHISDPSCDVPAAVEEFDIRSDFPAKAVEEAKRFGTQVSTQDIKGRADLRELETITIDPDTAKDFDDALNISKDPKGFYHLGVHIADVSHYVQPGTAIDIEARERCNSTYFPGTCIPMLPRELSENLCSLRPNVNRLAVSAMMRFDSEGNLLDYEFLRSVIKSKKRFTYKEALLVLEGKKKSVHADTLKLMVEFCHVLKKKRSERGSIEFSIPELAIIVNEKGEPVKTDYIPYDITHQLVEEFMLKANELVASHLSKQGKDITFRVHEVPSEENMKDFSLLASAFGFKISEKPTPQDLQQLFDEALNTSYGPFLVTSYIRKMRLAMYSPDNIGHYGLGLTHYCHFTSPIRRYVDLVVHRILFGDTLEYAHIESVSKKCSEQERISDKAGNNVVLLKKLRHLSNLIQSEPNKQFEAVVTRVRNFGVYFELLDLMVEGYFHVSELHDDYYAFDASQNILKGTRTGTSFFAGDKILVMAKNIDLILLQTKWNLVSSRTGKPTQRSQQKPVSKKPRNAGKWMKSKRRKR